MKIREAEEGKEKHLPVIEVGPIEFGKPVDVRVTVGKDVPHPNTQDHHISWVELYYTPKGSDVPLFLARTEFGAHGELDTLTLPDVVIRVVLPGPGVLTAIGYCNLHGLWKYEKEVR